MDRKGQGGGQEVSRQLRKMDRLLGSENFECSWRTIQEMLKWYNQKDLVMDLMWCEAREGEREVDEK